MAATALPLWTVLDWAGSDVVDLARKRTLEGLLPHTYLLAWHTSVIIKLGAWLVSIITYLLAGWRASVIIQLWA